MTTFETVSIGFSTIAMLTALYGIMSAFAAQRSAKAAEKQARHAETQAEAALAQAKSAEKQVEIARDANTLGGIARMAQGRRELRLCRSSISELFAASIDSRRDGQTIESKRRAAIESLGNLDDSMAVFPPALWRQMGNYIEQAQDDVVRLVRQADPAIFNDLENMASQLAALIEIEVGKRWATIENK